MEIKIDFFVGDRKCCAEIFLGRSPERLKIKTLRNSEQRPINSSAELAWLSIVGEAHKGLHLSQGRKILLCGGMQLIPNK